MCDICTPHLNLDFKITILAVMMFYLKSKNGLKWVPILNLDDFCCVSALSFFSQENILIIQKFEN